MENFLVILLAVGLVWWFTRHGKQSQHEKTEPIAAHESATPSYVAQAKRPAPLAGYDAEGDGLTDYVKRLVRTRSNLNCVFDLYVNSYMRGYSLQDKKRIRAGMKTIMESFDIIRNSKNGDTIISRLDVAVKHIGLLISEFGLEEAKKKMEIANTYRPAILTGAYFVDIQAALDKISSLKTQKSKQRYFENISTYINKIKLIGHTPQEELAALERFVQESQIPPSKKTSPQG